LSVAPRLEEVALSDRRWTGIAVADDGRVFVNFPRWSDDVPVSVLVVGSDGSRKPFPDREWNGWKPGDDPARAFVCVQSVHIDRRGDLYVLDPANPKFAGVVPGGPKLLRFSTDGGPPKRIYRLGGDVAGPESYLNDVRVTADGSTAYITDSGRPGLVVVDLVQGSARRRLDQHPALSSTGAVLSFDGRAWTREGRAPHIHSDGIALHPDDDRLYLHALTASALYELDLDALRRGNTQIRRVASSAPVDGMLMLPDGRLLLTGLEDRTIRVYTEGPIRNLLRDPRLVWPDSLARGPNGWVYVTTARIHEGDAPTGPFGVYRFRP
jgi:hypothetical protein